MLTEVIGYFMYVCTEPHSDQIQMVYRKLKGILILYILIIVLLVHMGNNVLIIQ